MSAAAKLDIRRRLERDYGYNPATMYPDLFGMVFETVREVDHARLLSGAQQPER